MLDLSNKSIGRFGLIMVLLAVLVGGCRKEILHEVGVIDATENLSEPVPDNGTWEKIDFEITGLKTLAIHNHLLYIGGSFTEEEVGFDFLAKFDGQTVSAGVPGSFFGFDVSALQTFEGSLYIGGDFSYLDFPNSCDNIFVLRNSSNEYYEFGGFAPDITGFIRSNSGVLVFGGFNNSHQTVQTSYTDRLVNGYAQGFYTGANGPLQSRINDVELFNGKLYFAGEGEIYPGVIGVGKWSGASMDGLNISSLVSPFDNYAESLAGFNDELYYSGRTFDGGTGVYKDTDWDGWVQVPQLSWFGATPSVLYVHDDYMYLAGSGITLYGVTRSNVIRFDGSTWSHVGEIKTAVHDLAVYKGRLYAAGADGLYQLN